MAHSSMARRVLALAEWALHCFHADRHQINLEYTWTATATATATVNMAVNVTVTVTDTRASRWDTNQFAVKMT